VACVFARAHAVAPPRSARRLGDGGGFGFGCALRQPPVRLQTRPSTLIRFGG
jgi:hypothetical protein